MITDYRRKIIRNEVKRLIFKFKDEEVDVILGQLQNYLNGNTYSKQEYYQPKKGDI